MASSLSMPPGRKRFLEDGALVKGKWRIQRLLGVGAFGEIYEASNTLNGEEVALKVEVVDEKKQALASEVIILKRLQGCPYVCQFITCGRYENYNFMVMGLLGDNLSEIRKRQPEGKFALLTTVKLAIQMIEILEGVHERGIVHRDIKPSNFVAGSKTRSKEHPSDINHCYLIDFGLSRKYLLVSGEVKPPRATAGFRGTARYASVNSHAAKELGRRDDLWSILYILVEFAQGTLPWRQLKEKEEIGRMKQQYLHRRLVEALPPEFEDFMNHLKTLEYEAKPDYKYLLTMFGNLYARLGGTPTTPFEWEVNPQPRTSSNPIDIRPKKRKKDTPEGSPGAGGDAIGSADSAIGPIASTSLQSTSNASSQLSRTPALDSRLATSPGQSADRGDPGKTRESADNKTRAHKRHHENTPQPQTLPPASRDPKDPHGKCIVM